MSTSEGYTEVRRRGRRGKSDKLDIATHQYMNYLRSQVQKATAYMNTHRIQSVVVIVNPFLKFGSYFFHEMHYGYIIKRDWFNRVLYPNWDDTTPFQVVVAELEQKDGLLLREEPISNSKDINLVLYKVQRE